MNPYPKDPLGDLMSDAMASCEKTVAQAKEATQLQSVERLRLLGLIASGIDTGMILDEIDYMLLQRWYDGRSHELDKVMGRLRPIAAVFADNGDGLGLPLVSLGQGDYTKEVRP